MVFLYHKNTSKTKIKCLDYLVLVKNHVPSANFDENLSAQLSQRKLLDDDETADSDEWFKGGTKSPFKLEKISYVRLGENRKSDSDFSKYQNFYKIVRYFYRSDFFDGTFTFILSNSHKKFGIFHFGFTCSKPFDGEAIVTDQCAIKKLSHWIQLQCKP